MCGGVHGIPWCAQAAASFFSLSGDAIRSVTPSPRAPGPRKPPSLLTPYSFPRFSFVTPHTPISFSVIGISLCVFVFLSLHHLNSFRLNGGEGERGGCPWREGKQSVYRMFIKHKRSSVQQRGDHKGHYSHPLTSRPSYVRGNSWIVSRKQGTKKKNARNRSKKCALLRYFLKSPSSLFICFVPMKREREREERGREPNGHPVLFPLFFFMGLKGQYKQRAASSADLN